MSEFTSEFMRTFGFSFGHQSGRALMADQSSDDLSCELQQEEIVAEDLIVADVEIEDNPDHCCHVRKAFLPPKMLFLTYYAGASQAFWYLVRSFSRIVAAGGALMPFMALFYRSRGLSHPQVGLIVAIAPVMGLVGSPLWSFIADRYRHRYKELVLFLMALVTLLRLCLMLVPPNHFALLAGVVLLAEFFSGPSGPLVDNAVMELLGKYNLKAEYGKQRMFGAVGWGLSALVSGWLMKTLHSEHSMRTAFAQFALLMGVAISVLAVAFTVHLPKRPAPSCVAFKQFLQPHWINFLSLLFVMGIGTGTIANYLFLYLDTLVGGNDRGLYGLSILITCSAELPFFWYSGAMMKRIGVRGVLAVAMGAYVIRLFYYAQLCNAWWVLLSEPLHGLTFAAMWAACVEYADRCAPPGLSATAQGLTNACFRGLGMATGGVLGGFLFERVGPQWLFRIMALTVSVAGLVYGLVSWFVPEPASEATQSRSYGKLKPTFELVDAMEEGEPPPPSQ